MTTSKSPLGSGITPEMTDLSGLVEAMGQAASVMTSLPDVGVLTQLANEMYRMVPGAGQAPSMSVPAMPSMGALPTGGMPMPSSGGMPSMGTLPSMGPVPQSMPASLADVSSLLKPVETFITSDVNTVAQSGYYFLEQATTVASPTAVKLPTSYEFIPELTPMAAPLRRAFDVNSVRRDFPILEEMVNGKKLVWLDNAATTQKPQAVINRLAHYYAHENSNIHRAAHTLAARSTDAYEGARDKVRGFLNAPDARNIVFTRGTTEAINLVAQTFGKRHVKKDDEIVITWLEHHSNIVPWQQLCAETGARLRVVPVDDNGQILLDAYERILSPRTRLVSMTHVSNALGTVTPAAEMVEMAHRVGARVLVDGAQAVSHMPVDVQALDCDWYVLSGHKMFAPTGIGALYGKSEALELMPPWQGGGNMIADVTFDKTVYHPAPMRFEAGTGNIADAVGLGAAIDYLNSIGMENVARYEHELLEYATKQMRTVPGLKPLGTAADKAGVLSFNLDGYRSEDVGAALSREGIAVRAGHHCAQPILRRFGTETSVRPSLALYNTCEEIDQLIEVVRKLAGSRR